MDEPLTIEFDSSVFSIIAIQKACYRFSNITSFEIQTRTVDGREIFSVMATPLVKKSDERMLVLRQQLLNEALDQQLREKIGVQTEAVRNLILAHAFSKTGLISSDGAQST
jgi:His-Xaa-Ser system protein HxsD